MMHILFELMPLLIGAAYGLVTWDSGWRRLWPTLIIGALCAGFAGELTQGPAEAVKCLVVDSTAALAGCLLIRLARRLITRRQS